MGFGQIGVAVPNFWFAMLLVVVFACSSAGSVPAGRLGRGHGGGLGALVLPAIALALPQAAILARVTRSSTLDVLGEDYIRTARAKGLPNSSVLWRHVLRNALIGPLTIMGLQFSFLLSGTISSRTSSSCLVWVAGLPSHRPARSDRGEGRGGDPGRRGDRREHGRRHRLRRHRPETEGA